MDFVSVRSESAIIHAFPFNSEKKRGGVAVKKVIQNFSLICKILDHLPSVVRLYVFLMCEYIRVFWQSNSEVHVHWKGAAEIVLACCTSYMDKEDNVVPLDENEVLADNKFLGSLILVLLKNSNDNSW